jgi:trypsin
MSFKVSHARARTARSWAAIPVVTLGLALGVPSTAFAGPGEPQAQAPHHSNHLVNPASPRGGLRPLQVAPDPKNVNPDIVGGKDATQGELGFLAFVAYLGQDTDMACSGTVVAANVVLTAAHCALDESTGAPLDPSGFRVVTGSVDWTNTSVRQVSGVSRVIVDPAYNSTNHNSDAALLVLSTPTSAPTVRLAGTADRGLESGGTDSAIAGWGETFSGSDITNVLQWGETVVQSPAYCSQFIRSYAPGFQLCAVDYPFNDTGTCNGDSGGPLLATDTARKLVEIGITSYGPADCNTSSATYYTAARSISAWATGQINAANPTSPPSSVAPPAPGPRTSSGPSRPQLPRMSLATARAFTRKTLAGALGKPFKRGHSLRTACRRSSAIRYSCGFKFSYSGNDYYGNIAVFYVYGAKGTKVFWTDKYMIHWVNDACYFHSGHRSSCAVYTKHGVW